MVGKVVLKKMEFFAFHGCYPQERIDGNNFIVHIEFNYSMLEASKSDQLEHSIDYTKVFEVVKRKMESPVNLLEFLVAQIGEALQKEFPAVSSWKIKVEKCHPPIDGKIESVGIEMEF